MNKTAGIIVGIVATVGVVLGVANFGKTINVAVSPTPVQVNVPRQEVPVVNIAPADVRVNVPESKSALTLGAQANPDVYYRTFMREGITVGGRMATSSTASTYTTASRDFNGTPSMILWTPNVNTTVSLSSTSTFAYVPQVGDIAKVVFLNASTTAASAITFAAVDANLDLQFSEATGGDLVLNGLDWAEFTIIRQSASKVSVIFNEFTEAD